MDSDSLLSWICIAFLLLLAAYFAVAGVIVWRTRVHLLWLLGAGALLGVLGFV